MGTRVEQDTRHSSPNRARSHSDEGGSPRGRERSKDSNAKNRPSRGTSSRRHSKDHESSSSSKLGKSTSSRRRSVPARPHRRRSSSRSHRNDVSFGSSMPSLMTSPRRKSSRLGSSTNSMNEHKQRKPRSHDLLNNERALHSLPPLVRTSFLDKIAQTHAAALAREEAVYHSVTSAAELHIKLQAQTSVAENVQSGLSMEEMHEAIMTQVGSSSYNNILGLFEEVGIGKARGKDGRLYMCQVFRTK